jgi:hypothetical protein
MLAVGCLLPFLILLGGAILGAQLGGAQGSLAGGIAGFAIGLTVPAIGFWMLRKATADKEKR